MTTLFDRAIQIVRSLPTLYLVGGAVVVVAVISVGLYVLTRTTPEVTTTSNVSHVQLASVGDLSSSAGPLPVTGKVTSLSEAAILAQASGAITTLSHSLGNYVGAGAVIARFENASQQAAVTQAEGSYDAAVAALARVTGSTSDNTTNVTVAALQTAYAALDDAIQTRADELFINPHTNPVLALTVPDAMLVNRIENERLALAGALESAKALSRVTTPTDVVALGEQMAGHLKQGLTLLNDLVDATNKALVSANVSAANIATYQTSLATARTQVVAALAGLTTGKSTYEANDARAAEAVVKQARGALDAAKAGLEKTIVRSPISGTIVSLPIRVGDYVSANTPVAIVSNPGALYVEADVTSEDAKTLAVGNKALVDDAIPGTITFIAPALDPTTGKIQVKISITGPASALTNGDITSVALNRTKSNSSQGSAIVIPIIAAKISPAGPIVFSVGPDSTLEAHPIELGSILGDRIVVLKGLTSDMEIVTDARGLAAGETVIVEAGL